MTAQTHTLSPAQVVSHFLTLLSVGDVEGSIELLADDVQWRNSKCPTIRGQAVAKQLRAWDKRGVSVDITTHHLAADHDTVLTDRTDVIGWGRWSTSFWVAGTFTVHAGKITVWDDRFSIGSFIGASVVGLRGFFKR